jgi:hypothetical protein
MGPTPTSRATCQPRLLQIPDHSNEVIQVGAWQYAFNVLLVGCAEDLESISAAQKDGIIRLAKQEFERWGLRIMAEARTPALRSRFRASVNELLGVDVVSDMYLNLLAAGESL